ncbi:unnamed protein product [Thelazia callipaeda]|uniref:Cytochrome-b5 reductase n=1 Tax=Thelazia callipaeda TaxID=103827 RepID=A0A0N5CJ79_THECL|nr:unnamed protein product [Thelazia callipaeda]
MLGVQWTVIIEKIHVNGKSVQLSRHKRRDRQIRRPKAVLAKSRSLIDWIRLTSSKSSKVKTEVIVDHEGLAKHTNINDCWILLGEKVYDVTEYLLFHPGGADELLRVAGTDGTDLFNTIHSWVNYDAMLKTCFVVHKPKLAIYNDETVLNMVGFEKAGVRIEDNFDDQVRLSCSEWGELKDENISLELKENKLRILLHFSSGNNNALSWANISSVLFIEPFLRNIDGSTISLSCIKNDHDKFKEEWASGIFHYKPIREYRNCKIHRISPITHNICLIILQMPPFSRLMVPVGHHVRLRISRNGEFSSCGSLIERPYTPVALSKDGRSLSFLIKFYENGIFTSLLRNKKCGDLIEVSDPLGCFNAFPDSTNIVFVLAAGTGLSPMIRLAAECLNNNISISLLIFNRKLIDIVPKDHFGEWGIRPEHPLLNVVNCLSEPGQEWCGEKGFISKDLLSKYIDESTDRFSYRIYICGPDLFTDCAAKLLDELQVPENNIYIFRA